jgi:L-aminopeptidase/D-esterase-like protein
METPAGSLRPGPGNGLIDVAGLQVGHAYRHGEGWLTGTTVIVTPAAEAVAGVGHDGLARAVRPAHSMFDGDTIFGLSTGGAASHDRDARTYDTAGPAGPSSPMLFHQMLAVAADCFTRAIVHAVLSAASVTTPAGNWPAYLGVFGSADRR